MPFNGSGVYSLPSTTVTPAVSATTIDSADFNTFTADLATALTLCIAKDGQTASPTLTSPIVNEILDSNSNENLEFGTTALAVNNLKVTNAATGNVPTISTSGEVDIGIDFENSEGEELLQLVATASAVNNVRVTNAATGNPALIDVSETNGDLQLAGNGTGGAYGTLKQATTQATTSGTEKDFTIPSWAKRITVMFEGVSTDTTSFIIGVRIGTGGVPDTSGYLSRGLIFDESANSLTAANLTTGIRVGPGTLSSAAGTTDGVLHLYNITGNTWIGEIKTRGSAATNDFLIGTVVHTLSGSLDILRFYTVNGDIFDAGQVNIIYEG